MIIAGVLRGVSQAITAQPHRSRRVGGSGEAPASPEILAFLKLGDFCADNDREHVPKWSQP